MWENIRLPAAVARTSKLGFSEKTGMPNATPSPSETRINDTPLHKGCLRPGKDSFKSCCNHKHSTLMDAIPFSQYA